jgi:predicted fused transcriptional regulator/phosphomethylpyrimidine kinase
MDRSEVTRVTLLAKYNEWRLTAHGREVYGQAAALTRKLQASGRKHYSIRAIVNYIRFEIDLAHGTDRAGWKVNNNMTPYLARELESNKVCDPGFFEKRKVAEQRYEQADIWS